ncbi:hypothetical protein BT69DRAFT_767547 [Atractiella rhizophila]|nr:hypothetical protein BT69DRAFT_767547 [Atractiella rhizophila]
MPSAIAPTKKHVAENPAKDAVTHPTDPKTKGQDIERKLKFYEIFNAFRAGKVPDNNQVNGWLKELEKAVTPADQTELSAEGHVLVEDVQAILQTTRRIVREKNADELFQEFLWNTRGVEVQKGNLKDVSAPVDKEGVNKDAAQAAEHFRTLGKLVASNSEFRKLLKDSSFLGRDILADAFTKAANTTRPTEEQIADVDNPAPSNKWEGPKGQTFGAEGSAAQEIPDARAQLRERVEDEMRARQVDVDGLQREIPSAQQATEEAQGTENADQAKGRLRGYHEKVMSKIPDERKEQLKGHVQDGKDYFKDKFPEERRERYIYRLKKVVVEQQRHRDYQDAVDFFLNMAENYTGYAKHVGSQGGDKGMAVLGDPSFKQAQRELRTLLERFANNQPFQPVIDAVNQIYTDSKEDPELRAWFKTLDGYIRKVLQEPGYVLRDDCDRDGRRIWDEGRQFWDGKYKGHRENLFDELGKFFTAYADDPLNVQLGNDWKKLTKDLLFDSEGSLKYKPHLWNDVRTVIAPKFFTQLGYIPIPRIEYTDPQLDLVIENLTLEAQNLLPNVIEMEIKNWIKLSPYKDIKDQRQHSFWLSFGQCQADLRDVAFYIRKKSFPKLSDSGIADVVLSGKGISGKVHIESHDGPGRVFNVVNVKCKVDKLKFAIREAKHSTLYALARPLATGLIKKQIAKAIEDAIKQGLVQLDAQLVDMKERMEATEGGKKEAFNQLFAKKDDAKTKVEEKTTSSKESTFKLVSKRDSKIIDWASKDSMVDRAMEKGEIKGDRWKSPTFDVFNTGIKA